MRVKAARNRHLGWQSATLQTGSGRVIGGHQRAQRGAFRGAQLPQRFGLDLANPLARDVEFLSISSSVCSRSQPIPNASGLPSPPSGKGLQNAGGFIANVGFDHGIDR